MKCTAVIMLAICLQVSATGFSQKVSISVKKAPLETVFGMIKKSTGYNFLWDEHLLKGMDPVTLNLKNTDLKEVLDQALSNTSLRYRIIENVVVIDRKPVVPENAIRLWVADTTVWVRGVVQGTDNKPIAGVSVTVRSKENPGEVAAGTTTDARGFFQIRAVAGSIVNFTAVGYTPYGLKVTGAATLQVKLETKQNEMDAVEVVVNTGYQKIDKSKATAAYNEIDNKELNRKVNVDLLSALEGKMPGMSTFKNNMTVRGASTLSSGVGSRPLIVIDGLPTEISGLSNDDMPGVSNFDIEKEKLGSIINPNDIESITLLKDAAAAAIYGARAANGVLVITTKSGRKLGRNKTTIQASTDMMITDKPNLDKMHYASTSELIDYEMSLYQRLLKNYNNDESTFWGPNGIGYIGANRAINYYSPLYNLYRLKFEGRIDQKGFDDEVTRMRGLDYRKEFSDRIWRNPFRQNYNVAIGSSNEKQEVYFSFNYMGQRERMISDNNETFNIYLKAGQQLGKRVNLSVGVNTQYYRGNLINDNTYTSPTGFIEPYSQILDEQGNRVYRDWVNKSDGFATTGLLAVNGRVAEQIDAINALKANRLKSPRFNMFDEMDMNSTKTSRLGIRSFANLDVKLFKGLTYTSSFQYEVARNKTEFFLAQDSYQMRFGVNRMASNAGDPLTTPNTFIYALPETGGRLQQTSNETSNYTWRNQLNYNKYFNRDHSLTAIAGTEIRQNYTPRMIEKISYGYDPVTLAFKPIDEFGLGNTGIDSYIWARSSGKQRVSAQQTLAAVRHRFFSTYATANYTYKGKYLLAGSVRIDQADLFGSDPKFRYRPLWSVSAGWNMSEESFMEHLGWIDMLKLRTSYGVTGNVDQTSSPYIIGSGGTTSGHEPSYPFNGIFSAPNPLLRWERSTTWNAGFDFAVLKGRLRGSLDFYRKFSDDLLATQTLDPTNGFVSARINNGAMLNKGIELNISGDWLKTSELTLSSLATFAYNKNEVKKIALIPSFAEQLIVGGYFVAGRAKDALYAYQYAGLSSGGNDAQNGLPLIYLDAGKNTVNVANVGSGTALTLANNVDAVKYMGSAVPVWNASFQQSIAYKGFDLNVLFIAYGGYKFRKDAVALNLSSIGGGALDRDIANSWRPDNTNTDIPKTSPDYTPEQSSSVLYLNNYWKLSDKHVINANYIRLRNVTLGYTLPASLAKKAFLQQVRFSCQVNNPWYWFSGGDDIDPDTFDGVSGTRNYVTPASWIFRLDVTL